MTSRSENCKNAQCSVIKIRAAKATQQDFFHEVHRQRVQGKRSVVIDWEVIFEEGGVGVAKKQSGVESSTAMVTPAKSKLVEPCFVNPSSHAAVKELMRHVSRLAGVTKYGGSERQWVAMTCDGVPYMLMRKVIQESRLLATKSYLQSLSWIGTTLNVKDLKAVLNSKSLPVSATKADLLARVDYHINGPVVANADVRSLEGEVDWVVPCMGGFHQELMICRTFVDVNWDMA